MVKTADDETSIRVLVADDREPARRGVEALLSTFEGIEVIGSAIDGREAVQLAGSDYPDLVLMDGLMPVLDGLEATSRIKKRHPEIGVVVFSVYGHLAAAAQSAGADAFLIKGCSGAELEATLREVVSRFRPSSEIE